MTFPRGHGDIQTIGITAFRCHNRVSVTDNSVYMGPGNPNSYPAAILAGSHHVLHRAGDAICNQAITADLHGIISASECGASSISTSLFSRERARWLPLSQLLRLDLRVRRRLARDFSDVTLCDEVLGTFSVASSRFCNRLRRASPI